MAVGRRVDSVEDLAKLALEKRAVILPISLMYQGHQRFTPAAWAINMTGQVLVVLLRRGIYVYEKGIVPANDNQKSGA